MTNLSVERLNRTTDAASLAAFRIIFGVLVFVGSVRFLERGWIDQFFVQPTYFFKFYWAPWVNVGPGWLMYTALGVMAFLGLMIAIGAFYRVCMVLFVLVFAYVELTDVTNYLNHYYQMSLLGVLLCVLPLHRKWSYDAKKHDGVASDTVSVWMIYLLRFQVGLVYVFAALAKCNSDWLVHAQPLNIWLMKYAEIPMLGPIFGSFSGALAMSWLGFLHDLLIVPALLWRRTRLAAYVVLVVFHVVTGLLFNIGMFPLIMIGTATVFFDSNWPKVLIHKFRGIEFRNIDLMSKAPRRTLGRAGLVLVILWCSVHVLMPLRSLAYAGPVNWHEQGMRFAWKVMVREKSGSVTYRIRHEGRTRDRLVAPSRYLTSYQEREMSGQPDLILQLAHHIAGDFSARGYRDIEVRVDAMVAWNGRPARRLIDPKVDLTKIKDGFQRADWILPAPTVEPIRLERRRDK